MMVYLHMGPDVSSVRVYDQPNGYEQRLPYRAIFQIKHLTEKIVYLCGAAGQVDRETQRRVLELLHEQGITTVVVERHGKTKSYDLERLRQRAAAPAPQAPGK